MTEKKSTARRPTKKKPPPEPTPLRRRHPAELTAALAAVGLIVVRLFVDLDDEEAKAVGVTIAALLGAIPGLVTWWRVRHG